MTRPGIFRTAILAIISGFVAVAAARAHESHPALLQIRQLDADSFAVLWRVPEVIGIDNAHPSFPQGSRLESPRKRYSSGEATTEEYDITCPGGLVGKPVALTGPLANLLVAFVQITLVDGSQQTTRLSPVEPSVTVAGPRSFSSQALIFLRAGIEHILSGPDHLLFVLGLMILVQGRWRLLKTITAFTAAHSLTLALAVLGIVDVPTPPVEACIALSLVFLAREIVRADPRGGSLLFRRPWIMAFSFGLLHGIGFASGLQAIASARSELTTGLVMFNAGVEIGQLSFVAVVLGMGWAYRGFHTSTPKWLRPAGAYLVGILGAFWTIERITRFL